MKNKCIDCGKEISKYSKRCKNCNNKLLFIGKKHSKRTKQKIRLKARERWQNKEFREKIMKSLRKAYDNPERGKKISLKLKNNPKLRKKWSEKRKKKFSKSQRKRFKKIDRKKVIARHHIDLNKDNKEKENILLLNYSVHRKLHNNAYRYLVKMNQIKDYLKWFDKNYGLK